MTEPSRCRKPRTSTASPARWAGRAPVRDPKTVKSRVVSRHVGTRADAAAAAGLRASSAMARSLRAGSSSSQGSSVSETRIVSPSPSCAPPPQPRGARRGTPREGAGLEEGADADGRLHPPVLALPRLPTHTHARLASRARRSSEGRGHARGRAKTTSVTPRWRG